jgi:alpha-tubulin suppressor-like RCC1 family protein
VQCSGEQPQVCNAGGAWQSIGPSCANVGVMPGKKGAAPTGESCCAGACIDTSSDPNNCGSCGYVCPPTTDPNASGVICSGGQCQPNCNGVYSACGTQCVDLSSDPNNCGGCGNTCSGNCTNGTCSVAVAVTAGVAHTCALLASGEVECTGWNLFGQLGNGTLTDSPTPVRVANLSGVTAIAAGNDHTCAVLTGGTVKCWGDNTYGELGDGTINYNYSPRHNIWSSTPVAVLNLTDVTALTAGNQFTCALKLNGTVACWGGNFGGELGNGTSMESPTPVSVVNLPGVVSSIASGYSHTCALLSGGTLACWGENGSGQLGDGTTVTALAPVVPAISGATAVTGGFYDTCVALQDGTAACWGYDQYGELGNDSTSMTPVAPSPVSRASGVTQLSAGQFHTCALTGAGTECWGYNGQGQLGNGTNLSSLVPVASSIATVTSIATGYNHTCAIRSGGAIACWGANGNGQFGNGTTVSSSVPVGGAW